MAGLIFGEKNTWQLANEMTKSISLNTKKVLSRKKIG
jgi:hypothetical protein